MSAENGFRQVHLCAPCARLNFRDVALGNSKAPCFSRDDGFMDFADCVPHHDGLEEVIECARAPDGCELCKSFVLKWVARGEGFRWPDDDDDGWYIDAKALVDREPRLRRCVLLMAPHYQYPFYETTSSAGVALWLIEEDKNLQMDMPLGFAKFSFRRDCLPSASSPFFQHIRLHDICKDSRTMECMKIAREWLRNCLDNHDSCRGPAGSDRRLPSRVIDVGDEEHDPKLVVTDHAVGEYAVLSYCWGKSTHQHVTLSLQNLDAFQKLIPLSSLPMTLQDAIFAARGLGIQYLWVDALCIIQDSVDDWTHEAGSMNDVYSNAVVALFATTAASAAEGFLGERIIKPTQYLMPHSVWKPDPSDPKTTDQDNPQIFLALNDWGAENDDAYHRDSKVYQWRKRGWTMQERLSPTRGISFNKIQMEWSCLTLAERENRLQIKHASQRQADLLDYVSSGYGVGLLSSLSERWNALIRIQEVQATHLGAENYEKLAIQLWYRLVNHYRTRELSNESDRLPAIAGLARILEDKMPGNHYLAGLWEKDLPLGFSWGVIAHHILPGRAQPASPLTRKESAATPSWSWASVAHGTYATYNFHEEVDESTTESLMFVHTPDAVSYRERFIPRSPLVLRITAPAMKLSNNWHSMEYPTEEQDLTQAALETLLRRKLSNDQAGKENSCDDIKELFRSSEFVQKREPCPGQHFLIIQVFRRTPKDLDILESDVEFSSIFFLILESVPGRRNRYRRVLELHLAEGNMGRTGTDFILERQDQKIYKGNLLRMIRGQQWVNHDIELE